MSIGCVVVVSPYQFKQLKSGEVTTEDKIKSGQPLRLWPGHLLTFQSETDINGNTKTVGIVMSEKGLLEAVDIHQIRITGLPWKD